ncbi:heavy metal translocating P-type ATPase [Falseniella ignava]|uniref:Cd(2+)-exporting ATPase n=1 Tax=Falseniella ignava CCUG 37419 TaxID=883112 RepID=K1MLE6_9LACT|nr:heavy metal translocating P-type ATPase [Falseniella ignava]EKB56799.1 heavy metal translocating P-type ATPase [Falseniella ignava CCUG 37419]
MKHTHHHHEHHHNHGKAPIISYLTGLILALVGLFLRHSNPSLANVTFVLSALLAGYHVIIMEGVSQTWHETVEHRSFKPNAHILMGLASIGSMVLGEYWEGALLILIFAGAHFLEDWAQGKSQREISKLMAINPTTARKIMSDGSLEIVSVDSLQIGDQLQVLNGDRVPIDGVILSGRTSIDESTLNGESLPKEKTAGDLVYGSTLNGTGSFTMEVSTEPSNTLFAKIIQLVEQNQTNQAPVASFIQQYEPSYVNLVLILVICYILFSSLLFNIDIASSFYRGLVLLVSASPCALAASTVSATLSATSTLARKGVMSKGSVFLDRLAQLQAIAFDKTGTLTRGQLEVTDVIIDDEFDPSMIHNIVVALERESNHPLAQAMLRYFTAKQVLELEVNNIIGHGLEAHYHGDLYQLGKPTEEIASTQPELSQQGYTLAQEGKTVTYLARNGQLIAVIALMDEIKDDAPSVIQYFKQHQIHTTLITGDSKETGEAVGKQLQLDTVLANVLPEEKSNLVASQKQQHGTIAMVGDGVNDAPALVQADIGIAMGQGTDVAIEVSDLVLMQNDLSRLVEAHQLAHKMTRIIRQNIIFGLAVVIFLITVNLLGLSNITLSVIVHEGSTLVVILNGLRLLKG